MVNGGFLPLAADKASNPPPQKMGPLKPKRKSIGRIMAGWDSQLAAWPDLPGRGKNPGPGQRGDAGGPR